MFKFLHVADVHLDSPLRGLERYDGAPADRIRHATRRALERMVDLAIDEGVAFVVVAGDLYDGDWRDYNTGLFLAKALRRLTEARIPVVMIAGNHDAANKMTRALRLPENVTMLATDRPQSFRIDDWNVAIHGQGFATQAVDSDLSEAYPAADPGLFNIGLLHTCASGSDDHARYAPCTVDGLRAKGYGYWALGHIHKRDILHEDPLIVFPGNLQGRHARELGPKGCMLVTVRDGGVATPEFRRLDVATWESIAVDADTLTHTDDLIDTALERLEEHRRQLPGPDHLLATRVRIVGTTDLHDTLKGDAEHWASEIRNRVISACGDQVWVEKVKFETKPPHTALVDADGPLGELHSVLESLRSNEAELIGLAEEVLGDLRKKLPAELRAGDDAVDLHSAAYLREILEQVEPFLKKRLLTS